MGVTLLVGQQALGCLADELRASPCPRRSVARIDRQHFAVERVGLLERLGRVLQSELDGLQVERVRLGIGRARLRRRAEQRDLELLDHVGRDLVLDREDVVELAVVGLRPQVRVGAGLDQLRRDPHRLARLAHRAFEHVRTCSVRAISGIAISLPLKENDEVRAVTCNCGIFASRFSSSSEMPSEKYSLPCPRSC